MKKTLLFVLALMAVGCADPIPRNLDDLSMRGPQYLDPETLEPYSGPAYRMSEDDSTQIVLRVNLRNGRFHGDFEDFAPEGFFGRIYETGTYRDGQREGRFENFYPSGVFRGRGTYENGLKEGPYESYYEDGRYFSQLWEKGTYTAGKLDGPYELYHENGQIRARNTYRDGQLDSPYELYNENGQLTGRTMYRAGERHGLFEHYDDNGQLNARGYLNMGSFCGEWIRVGQTTTTTSTYDPCPPGLEDGN